MVTTLSADRLAELQDADEEYALLDTRPEESFESWHVTGAINFPFDPEEDLEGRLEELEETVNGTERVLTVCAKGLSSANLATQLESATDEYDVAAIEGGMKGWSRVYDRARISAGDSVTLVQVQRRAKGCLSYLVGCPETGDAVVVDPTADTDEFAVAAEEAGLSIVGVIDTHVHADHVSGGRELADRLEVPYYLGERVAERGVEVEYTPLERNEVLEVGTLGLKALETPGHTSEMLSILIDDRALLTADTLHVDSTGRTELEFNEDEGERGARMLYESLHRTVLAEPESVVVCPGHVTVTANGEFSHGSPGEPIETTIRAARTGIDVLDLEEAAFVDRLADAGEKPTNYEEIIDHNRGTAAELESEDRLELELGPNNCSA
ncbi:MBL fold metallo-hydrolase [Halostagnicola kamekurae]|uniref:Glyoxylase, beta-lactamase superfamily II n=1 Tax=Halostagnicola kamekurae TaxID=619731 RepID=A0A1I6PVJ2_9EURY|nr:MBL fold metallo-hydrolase [Halostagnicola kamekurae]SFS44088.1 Glyoxylase, beta-lactamase superfamily II [Halostagnicola kamekurae]